MREETALSVVQRIENRAVASHVLHFFVYPPWFPEGASTVTTAWVFIVTVLFPVD